MSTPTKTLLITGATGRQGSGVIAALLSSPQSQSYTILAVTRDPSSPAAQALTVLSPGRRVRLLKGDLDDIPALFASAASASPTSSIWGVYSVQASAGRAVTESSETRQGTALVDAALAHGVSVFVYSSVDRGGDDASWENQTPVGHFRTKYQVEHHLRRQAAAAVEKTGTTMRWTILRPVAFMDNLAPTLQTRVFLAALRNHVPPTKKMQWVASSDVGHYAAMAFASPGEWHGRAVGIAGDELTMEELSRVFERAVGRPERGTYWVLGSVLTAVVREMGLMIGWFASDGYKADVAARRAEYPGLMDLEGYLRGNGEWQAVAVGPR
ncbi:NAD(P)-binding protein [Coniochaeta hoffmannii]|uniref:NAD(P)-binding protein n=1 Tax=Coniochaeta hoffmannii TaxID=91930 RepID=A0AA38VI34_9PEZI|nr:NAD(P)-binding protein [Coniochaeta hoffmannii]